MRTAPVHSEARQRLDNVQPRICRVKQSITTTRNNVAQEESWKLVISICQLWLGLCGLIFSTLRARLGRRHTFGWVSPFSRMILSTVLRLM